MSVFGCCFCCSCSYFVSIDCRSCLWFFWGFLVILFLVFFVVVFFNVFLLLVWWLFYLCLIVKVSRFCSRVIKTCAVELRSSGSKSNRNINLTDLTYGPKTSFSLVLYIVYNGF